MNLKRIQLSIVTLMATLVSGWWTASSSADEYRHIENQSRRIVRQADRLVRELHHFEHTPQFAHLVRDMQNLRLAAVQLADLTHRHGRLRQIERYIAILDSTLHHAKNLVDQIEHGAAHGVGHVDGNTRNTRRLMSVIEESIIHMQKDVVDLRRHLYGYGHEDPIVVPEYPVYPTPPISNPGCRLPYRSGGGVIVQPNGISLGNGRVQFRINF